jgi:hypothetical protein
MKNKFAIILRHGMIESKPTYGDFYLFDSFKQVYTCKTLELPWKQNQREISCIPTGNYFLSNRYSDKYKHHLLINNVEDRDNVLIHVANYASQLKGCIAPGADFGDIDKDGIIDVTSSRKTLDEILSYIGVEEVVPLTITTI